MAQVHQFGARGPKPDPFSERTRRRSLDLSAGVNPPHYIPSAPKHLGLEARKEWKRITPFLLEEGLISNLDRTALGLYCQAFGRLSELETSFNGMVDRLVSDGATYSDAVYRASYSVTPSGYAQQSVIVQLIKSHREQVNRYLGHFGLSPAARGRVQASNYVQPSLPGIEPATNAAPVSGFAKFGVVGGTET